MEHIGWSSLQVKHLVLGISYIKGLESVNTVKSQISLIRACHGVSSRVYGSYTLGHNPGVRMNAAGLNVKAVFTTQRCLILPAFCLDSWAY